MSRPDVSLAQHGMASPRARLLTWAALAIAVVGILSLCAVHAPQRIKLPVWSALGFGALAGWILARLALWQQVVSRIRTVYILTAVLVATGQVGIAFETYRLGVPQLEREMTRERMRQDPLGGQVDEYLREQSKQPGETRDAEEREFVEAWERGEERHQAREAQFQRLLTFQGYLEHRIPLQWGRWSSPWPEFFWGLEIALAAALAAFVARRTLMGAAAIRSEIAPRSTPDSEG